MAKNPITEDELERIISDYKSGIKLKQLCKKYHRSNTTISNALKSSNIRIYGSKLDDNIDEIIKLYNGGLSTCELGRRFGADPSTVRRELMARGIDCSRGRRKRTPAEVEAAIIKDYESGMTMAKTGEKNGVNTVTVMNILDKYGVPKRSLGGICKLPEETICEEYLAGEKVIPLSHKYGVSIKTIYDILRRHDIERDGRPVPQKKV